MQSTHSLEKQVIALEQELETYKKNNLTGIERRINYLLDQLDETAPTQTNGQRLRERLVIIAATAAIAYSIQTKPYQQPVTTNPIRPVLTKVQTKLVKPEVSTSTKPDINKLMAAISTQESGGDSTIINKDSGATGKWQVMPENIPSWSKAALGYEITATQFLASHELQEKIVAHRLGLYAASQSPNLSLEKRIKMIAAAWYSGDQKLYTSERAQSTNGTPYISVAGYARSVWSLYNQTSSPKYSETKQIISTWSESMQADPKTGDKIADFLVSSERGMRSLNGKTRMHQGVDLATPVGTPIYAIADGKIECDSWADAGTVAMFTSPDFPDLRFDLLHLSKCDGSRTVKKGEIIGLTGSYGTGPHLHLAIKGQTSGNFLRVRAGWLYWFIRGNEP